MCENIEALKVISGAVIAVVVWISIVVMVWRASR